MVLKDLGDTIGMAREIYGIGPTDLFLLNEFAWYSCVCPIDSNNTQIIIPYILASYHRVFPDILLATAFQFFHVLT